VPDHPILHRKAILSGTFERMIEEHYEDGSVRVIPRDERLAMLKGLLDQMPTDDHAWLFAYGSLMWNPTFDSDVHAVGLVRGYHRQFCFWSTLGRGSRETPGLMLALERGGACHGMVYGVRRERADEELGVVFIREMLTGSYRARLVTVDCGDRRVRAIAFIANRAHPTYAGRIAAAEAARHIACAEGRLGTCREYLYNTIERMRELGIRDHGLERLARQVRSAEGPR